MVRSCHPRPTLAVTAVSAGLAVAVGHGPLWTVLITAAVLAGQLSIGWSNDYLDRARDARAARADKPVADGRVGASTVRLAAVAAAVATVPLSLATGLAAGLLHLVAVASAWAYNLRLKATAWSAVPFAVSFGLLPAFVVAALPGHPLAPSWLIAAGALLGCGAHFANVLPDLLDDLDTGIRGMPHRLAERYGATTVSVVALALVVAASVLLTFGPRELPVAARVAAVPVTVLAGAAGVWRGRRGVFPAVIVVALVDVALLLLAGRGVR